MEECKSMKNIAIHSSCTGSKKKQDSVKTPSAITLRKIQETEPSYQVNYKEDEFDQNVEKELSKEMLGNLMAFASGTSQETQYE